MSCSMKEWRGLLLQSVTYPKCHNVNRATHESDEIAIKGALCNFGEEIQTQNFNVYNINEVIIQNQKYLFFP